MWRHDGDRLTVLGLQQNEEGYYAEIPESAFLAPARVSGASLSRFVEEGLNSGRPAWTRRVREWARDLRGE